MKADQTSCFVSLYLSSSLSVIVRMVLVIQGVEENPGPTQIFRMSSLDEPKVFSVDMMEISIMSSALMVVYLDIFLTLA